MNPTPISLAATAIAANELGEHIQFAITLWAAPPNQLEGVSSILNARVVLGMYAHASSACTVHDPPGSLGHRAIRIVRRIADELQCHAVVCLHDSKTNETKAAGSHPSAERARASVELGRYWTAHIGSPPKVFNRARAEPS